MTNTFLIGFSQIGNTTTCVQFNEVTKEQSSRRALLGRAPVVNDITDMKRDENRGLDGTYGLDGNDTWRDDNRGLDGYSDYSYNLYNNTVLADYDAFLSGMAHELIHTSYWRPSHGRVNGASDVGAVLYDITDNYTASRLTSTIDIFERLRETPFESVATYLAVMLVRHSWPPSVVAHGLLLAAISAFITYIVLVVMNFCIWAFTTSVLVLLIVHAVTCDATRATRDVTRAVLKFAKTMAGLLYEDLVYALTTQLPIDSLSTPSASLATLVFSTYGVHSALFLEGTVFACTRAS